MYRGRSGCPGGSHPHRPLTLGMPNLHRSDVFSKSQFPVKTCTSGSWDVHWSGEAFLVRSAILAWKQNSSIRGGIPGFYSRGFRVDTMCLFLRGWILNKYCVDFPWKNRKEVFLHCLVRERIGNGPQSPNACTQRRVPSEPLRLLMPTDNQVSKYSSFYHWFIITFIMSRRCIFIGLFWTV